MSGLGRGSRWLIRFAVLTAALVLVLPPAAAFVLLRTQPGHDFVLRAALAQVRRSIQGEVTVGAIRSDGLLRGFFLNDVSIADTNGRPFVELDSMRVRYSVRDLLRRDLVLIPVDIWRPRVVIEALHGEEGSNIARLFATTGGERSQPTEGPGEGGFAFGLRDTAVHEGELTLRLPVDARRSEGVYEVLEGPGEGLYRVLSFQGIHLGIADADLVGAEDGGQAIRFDHLSLTGHVLAEAFEIRDLRGRVAREGRRVQLDLDPLLLTGSELRGPVTVEWGGQAGVALDGEVEARQLDLADLRWLGLELPSGVGRLNLQVSGPVASGHWRFSDVDLEVGRSRVRGSVGLDLGSPIRFVETDLALAPVVVQDLNTWLSEPLTFGGEITGGLRLEGPPTNLFVEGRLAFADAEAEVPRSSGTVEGVLHLGESVGFSEFTVVADSLRYGTLSAFAPDLQVAGEGSLRVTATGDLSSAVQLSAVVGHRIPGGRGSQVSLSGAARRSDLGWSLALAGTMDPLSLDGVSAAFGRDFGVSGDLEGAVQLVGPLSDLGVTGSFETPGGLLTANVRLDAGDPLGRYRLDATFDELAAHLVTTGLPDPTIVSGTVSLDGSGFDPEELRGTIDVRVGASQLGRVPLESAQASLRAVGGRLLVERLEMESAVLRVSGSGELGLRSNEAPGRVTLRWAADSLASLRPIVFGDEEIVADTLTQLERDVLRLDGIDPDTLETNGRAVLRGSGYGELVLTGHVRDLEATGFAELADAAYGEVSLSSARADLSGSWQDGGGWSVLGDVQFDSLDTPRFRLEGGAAGVSYGQGGGDFELALSGYSDEVYLAEGSLLPDSVGMTIGVDALALETGNAGWALVEPTAIKIGGAAIETDGVRLVGSRDAGVTSGLPEILARGRIDLDGESDAQFSFEGVQLDQLAQLAQMEELPSGLVDLDVTLRGAAERPEIDADLRVRDLGQNGAELSNLEGAFVYRDGELRGEATGISGGRRLLAVAGRMPLDLALSGAENRFPEGEMDLTISVDSLPAALVLAPVEAMEDVQGALNGEIRLLGTRGNLEPTGVIRLSGGSFSLPGLGLRPTAMSADFSVGPDFAIEVQAEARSGGRAVVSGSIALADPLDPGFDLRVSATAFQAVERRDLTARVAGDLSLTGFYSEPQVSGNLIVVEGELSLDEFVRGAEVIDLSDPRFFDVVDTTLVASRPLAAAQNPFLQNLRVDVALALQQDFWIRSPGSTQGMDVEIGGDLTVNFNRPARELVLVGTLQAFRGSYAQFSRQFEIQSGTLEFPGTPGIDPSLAIEAVYRLRRQGAEPLGIVAAVGGTLLDPQVTLTSDAQPPIPESDLISYLIFGRPSYTLASGEISVLDEFLAGAANLAVSQFGTSVRQSIGVDYLSISQTQRQFGESATRSRLGAQFADTQVEMGRYIGDELFLSLALRPLTSLGPVGRRQQLPSLRLEWTFEEFWSMEGFFEERLDRQGTSGFGELDNEFDRTIGISLFREWGY